MKLTANLYNDEPEEVLEGSNEEVTEETGDTEEE